MSVPTAGAAATATRADQRFPCFDGLRAIAAIAVVFHHAAFTTAFELRGVRVPGTQHVVAIGHYFARMDAGVQVFFLISGFLLYRPFVNARFAGAPRPATRANVPPCHSDEGGRCRRTNGTRKAPGARVLAEFI